MLSLFFILLSCATCVALLGTFFYLHHNNKRSISEKELKQLRQQNHELEMRIENLETILTSIDPELLGGLIDMNYPKKRLPKSIKEKVKQLKKRRD